MGKLRNSVCVVSEFSWGSPMKTRQLGIYLSAVTALTAAGMLWAANTPTTGAASGPTKSALTFAPLPPGAPIYSHADVQASSSVYVQGKSPYKELTASHNSIDMTVGGTDVSILWNPPAQFGFKANGTTSPLQFNGTLGALSPANFMIGKTQKYSLAFPHASMAAGGKGISLLIRSGGVQRGSVAGQTVSLYDENTDGVYSMTDAIRVDNGSSAMAVFTPITKYLSTKNGIVEITEIAEDGSSITTTPHVGKTGKISWNPMLDGNVEVHAVFGSKDGTLNFELTSRGGSPSEAMVVPGDYEFLYGTVFSGRLNKISANIVPHTGGTITVPDDGGTVKADWGKAFNFEFVATKKGNKLDISPASIHLKGKGGEEYTNLVYEANPEVFLIADGRATSLGRMEFG